MPRGDKSSYTSKQKRKAEHIEESYEERGVSKKEAEKRAWATVNKSDKGGKKSGSGRGKKSSKTSSRKGGKKGGKSPAGRKSVERSTRLNASTKPRSPRQRSGQIGDRSLVDRRH